jgi:hypothetical protein
MGAFRSQHRHTLLIFCPDHYTTQNVIPNTLFYTISFRPFFDFVNMCTQKYLFLIKNECLNVLWKLTTWEVDHRAQTRDEKMTTFLHQKWWQNMSTPDPRQIVCDILCFYKFHGFTKMSQKWPLQKINLHFLYT